MRFPTLIAVLNQSGGNDSGIFSDDFGSNPDFDQGVANAQGVLLSNNEVESGFQVLIYGSNGRTTQAGFQARGMTRRTRSPLTTPTIALGA
jgi:hypothetical protein